MAIKTSCSPSYTSSLKAIVYAGVLHVSVGLLLGLGTISEAAVQSTLTVSPKQKYQPFYSRNTTLYGWLKKEVHNGTVLIPPGRGRGKHSHKLGS